MWLFPPGGSRSQLSWLVIGCGPCGAGVAAAERWAGARAAGLGRQRQSKPAGGPRHAGSIQPRRYPGARTLPLEFRLP